MTQLVAGQPTVRISGQGISIQLVLLLCLCCLAGCDEPFIVMSGDALSGDVTDPPADWEAFKAAEIVQLETNPADPYSINIWMVCIGPDIYVATGKDDTRWSRYIDEDPDVRLRIGQTLFELEATRVSDSRERVAVTTQYISKYDLDEDDNWVEDGQIFRLDRR